MKYYCNNCNILVCDITGMVRKGTIMICSMCSDRNEQIKVAEKFANVAQDNSIPHFMKEFFGDKHGFNKEREY